MINTNCDRCGRCCTGTYTRLVDENRRLFVAEHDGMPAPNRDQVDLCGTCLAEFGRWYRTVSK